MGEFSPTQLDALEDALEDLELGGLPAALEDDELLGSRLSEYRGLLQLSREAFPLADVPAGVLDDVLAQARNADAGEELVAQTLAPEQAASEQAVPWWKRMGLWIPMLAVGASAALMLVMVRTTLDQEPPAATVAQAEASESLAKDDAAKTTPVLDDSKLQAAARPVAKSDAPFETDARGRLRGGAVLPGSGVGNADGARGGLSPELAGQLGEDQQAGDDPFEEGAELEEDAEAAPQPQEPAASSSNTRAPSSAGKVPYSDEKKKSKGKSKAGKSKGGKSNGVPYDRAPAKPSPKSAPKAEPKPSQGKPQSQAPGGGAQQGPSDTQALQAAEAQRRAGKCGSAKATFTRLSDASDSTIRAKALAGLGLCALSSGDGDAAEKYFSRALKADDGVAAFIKQQRKSIESSAP